MELSFVETTVFTRRVQQLSLEQDLRALQLALVANPEAGRLDPGTGGLRKVRMASSARGKGKRSGARVHYLHVPHRERIYLIFVYGKSERDTLSQAQKAELRRVVEAIKRE
jgi:hypothetical protein